MKFFEYAQDQAWLFPPDLKELIKENDLSIVISDVVERIGVQEIENKYVEEGHPAYHPKMMVKIYFYAYALGIRSSRKIARELEGNIKFWYLSGRQTPDFRTISDFRKNHIKEIKLLFKKVVRLCREMGMVSLGLVAIDGTRIKANASEKENRTEEGLRKELERIEGNISAFLEEAEATDIEEDKKYGADKRGDEIPKELAKTKKRKEKLEEALERLKAEDLRKVNVTDNNAKIIRTDVKCFGPAYNCQTAVDEQKGIIIAAETFSEASDSNLLQIVTEAAEDNTGGRPGKLVSDCGYHSAKNIVYLEGKEIDGYIPNAPIKRIKEEEKGIKEDKPFNKEAFYYDPDRDCFFCPERKRLDLFWREKIKKNDRVIKVYRASGDECQKCKHFGVCTKSKMGRMVERDGKEDLRRKMAEKIRSREGMAIYRRRKHIAETPFANIKQNLRFRGFLLRGLNKVDGEFKLISAVHNIKMIYSFILKTKRGIGPPKKAGSIVLIEKKEENPKKGGEIREKTVS